MDGVMARGGTLSFVFDYDAEKAFWIEV